MTILLYSSFTIFLAFVIMQSYYILQPLFKEEKKQRGLIEKMHSFSVIVPAFNEEKVLESCIIGYCGLREQESELIIVNDGSTDHSITMLTELLCLTPSSRSFKKRLEHKEITAVYESKRFPNIFVIDKRNGGKSDALNAGINFSRNDIIVTLDADSILERNSLMEMNAEFQKKNVIACGGNVLIAQAFSGHVNHLKPTFKMKGVIKFQFLQYLTAFYLHKRAQASLGAMTVIAGAFGAFRRGLLFEVGGFRETIGEDMDITLKIQKLIKEKGCGLKISYVPSAVCYTECPETLGDMFKQRVRWQKGFIDCLIQYRNCFFRKLPFRFSIVFIFDQFMIGTLNAFPMLAIPAMVLLNQGQLLLVLLLGSGAVFLYIYQFFTTIFISHLHGVAFRKRDILRIIIFLPADIFFYRIMNLLFVAYGTLSFFYKSKSWNKLERSGKLAWKGAEKA
ncbi:MULTISPECIES: glycosyltransferase family 2 protein [Bacillus]|uniref:glycosyltransferase family 2 protein n=1 Tax=Bacillus TaxID=1386 RepID=UPI000C78A725|nr:glycosyltransferase [Bacillus sp. UMB0728]PLR73627.1 glycosyltransferase family 2 protein [Bacillus sp. UMB0728]